MKTAVVFLCTNPEPETISFAAKMSEVMDTFIVADSESGTRTFNISMYDSKKCDIKVICVEDDICKKAGYVNSNISDNTTHIKKNPIAMDKFLYSFCQHFMEYNFVWVLENDVLVPSVETLQNLTIGYSQYDLVVQNNTLKQDDLLDWHWRHVIDKIGPPYYNSMVCAMGISRKLLNCIKKYVDDKKILFYSEVMFNTIAMQNNLNVICPFELKSIVWQGDWHPDVIYQLPNNLFHPMKELEKYSEIRSNLLKWEKSGRQPEVQIPHFLKQLM